MNYRNGRKLFVWALAIATPGLGWQSIPAFGQSGNSVNANSTKLKTGFVKITPKSKQPSIPVKPNSELPQYSVQEVPLNSVQQVSDLVAANDTGKTEVQKQLEALYEQDGREMPDLNFNLQPLAPLTNSPQQPGNSGTRPDAVKPVQTQVPAPTQKSAFGYKQYQPQTQRPPATPYPVQPNVQQNSYSGIRTEAAKPAQPQHRQNPVTGFFKKLSGGNRNSTSQAPVPPDFANVPQNVPPVNQVNTNVARPAPQQANYAAPLGLETPSARNVNQTRMSTTAVTPPPSLPAISNSQPLSVMALPQPAVQLPTLEDKPTPLPINTVTVTIPTLSTETKKSIGDKPKLAVEAQPAQERVAIRPKDKTRGFGVEGTGDFPNPFPDLPESEIDVKLKTAQPREVATPKKTEVVVVPEVEEVTPKTIEPESNAESGTESERIKAPKSDDDPYAVDAKDFVEPLISGLDDSHADPSAPSLDGIVSPAPTNDGAPALISPIQEDGTPSAEPKKIDEADAADAPSELSPAKIEEPSPEKLKRLHERSGMKGLKGFCPVALRETRELVDALPEFVTTYRKQKYHFSSTEARDKFDLNPSRYAPAAYGADVVALSRDKDVVQGSLDFAAWYKGRLYLFGSQENYEEFIADPTKFATLDGVE